MARRWRSSCTALALACLGLLTAGGYSPALAVPCSTGFSDGAGNGWLQGGGSVAGIAPGGVGFSGFGQPALNGFPPTLVTTTPADCELKLDGRELVSGPQAVGASVTVARRFYVPMDTPAFARVVDTWKNVSAGPVTIEPLVATPLVPGAVWRRTSSGDAVVTAADDWVVLANTAAGVTPTQPVVAEIWSGPGATRRASGLFATAGIPLVPWTSGSIGHLVVYQSLTLQPGESRSLMSLFTFRPASDAGLTAAQNDAASLLASPERVFTGISSADQAKLVNWGALDSDADGLLQAVDNCPTAANPDQKDTDGDGQGDACDDDDDGDGLPDSIEALLGTNPLAADTDGDGRTDSADSCQKLAAATADGCPAPPETPGVPQAPSGQKSADTTAPVCAISGVAKTIKRKAFLNGVAATVTCDEPATVDAELLGSARSVRLAAAFNLTLGTRSLGLGGGARKVTIKPAKRLVGKAKKLTVQLRVTATDASGNRVRKAQTLKVK